ncbi:MAG TPA: hypothetical protein VHU19_04760 [Pyrinomonadaceae bacterium]|jgi:hypothetical protein|nr:hypothetical protein [Pyrinomonadaceae bacterium]
MNNRSFLFLSLTAAVFVTALGVCAQTRTPSNVYTRPRTVGVAQQPSQGVAPATQTPAPRPAATQTPAPANPARQAAPATTQNGTPPATQNITPAPSPSPYAMPQLAAPYVPLQPARPLSVNKFRERVAEAQRLLKSRLTLTSMTPNTAFVTVAALEPDSSKVHLLSVPKEMFLTRGAEVVLTTAQGLNVRLQIVRPNYVNTAVVVSEAATGKQLTPLVVEYPIEKFGSFREMAYYTSAHPALLSPEVVKQGQSYVHTMLDLAAQRLRERGKVISPALVDIAERLCVVEHIDHDRYRHEDRTALFQEVYGLYALNQLDTFRYSVSSAGAGGMVQMIPATYQMMRNAHPGVGLNPDFVLGMRNHGNALEAMLLYIQDTWDGMAFDPDITAAIATHNATQAELVAAGYNSNPAHLPLYLRRGGTAWRTLVPRETQMYLQIYQSLEGLVQFKNRGEKAQPSPFAGAPQEK